MSQPVTTIIGSGLGRHKSSVPAGTKNIAADLVAIANMEDASYCIAASGQTVAIGSGVASLIPSAPLYGRREVRIYNAGAGTVLIGSTSGSAVNGYPLLAGTKETFPIMGTIDLWGIGSGVASSLRILELA